jgi:hypothetical protein
VTVAVAVAGDQILHGVADLVGCIANAVFHAIGTVGDLVARSFEIVLEFVARVIRVVGGNCLGHVALLLTE